MRTASSCDSSTSKWWQTPMSPSIKISRKRRLVKTKNPLISIFFSRGTSGPPAPPRAHQRPPPPHNAPRWWCNGSADRPTGRPDGDSHRIEHHNCLHYKDLRNFKPADSLRAESPSEVSFKLRHLRVVRSWMAPFLPILAGVVAAPAPAGNTTRNCPAKVGQARTVNAGRRDFP